MNDDGSINEQFEIANDEESWKGFGSRYMELKPKIALGVWTTGKFLSFCADNRSWIRQCLSGKLNWILNCHWQYALSWLHSLVSWIFFKVLFAIVSSSIMPVSSLISLAKDDSTVDLACSVAAVPADMNSSLHLYTGDATLYFQQISAMVEEFESTSIKILAFSSFILCVPKPTISSPLEWGED